MHPRNVAKACGDARTRLNNAIHAAEGLLVERAPLHAHAAVVNEYLARAIQDGRDARNARTLAPKPFVRGCENAIARLAAAANDALDFDSRVRLYHRLHREFVETHGEALARLEREWARTQRWNERMRKFYKQAPGYRDAVAARRKFKHTYKHAKVTWVQRDTVEDLRVYVRSPSKNPGDRANPRFDLKPKIVLNVLPHSDADVAGVREDHPDAARWWGNMRSHVDIPTSPALGMSLDEMKLWYEQHITWYEMMLRDGVSAGTWKETPGEVFRGEHWNETPEESLKRMQDARAWNEPAREDVLQRLAERNPDVASAPTVQNKFGYDVTGLPEAR